MYNVYVLVSEKSDRLYIGQTNNLEDRLFRHNSNSVQSTRNQGPWKLFHYKQFESRSLAMKFEKYENIKE